VIEAQGEVFYYNCGISYRGDFMRVLLADDQIEVRLALKILLGQESGLDIVDETGELANLLIKTKESRPDLVLIDWELSNLRVSDIIPVLRYLHPELRIIAMSGRPEASDAAIAAGVDAFVSKGENSEKLLEAIKKVKKGNCHLSI
jgi:DNA-binding NarL/FixJ family response regulator